MERRIREIERKKEKIKWNISHDYMVKDNGST